MILSVDKGELEGVLKRSLISIRIIQIQENCHSRGSSCDNHIFIIIGRMLLTFLEKFFVNQTLIYCSKLFSFLSSFLHTEWCHDQIEFKKASFHDEQTKQLTPS